ncbi:UPS4, partial [Symbiodinium pilosum]
NAASHWEPDKIIAGLLKPKPAVKPAVKPAAEAQEQPQELEKAQSQPTEVENEDVQVQLDFDWDYQPAVMDEFHSEFPNETPQPAKCGNETPQSAAVKDAEKDMVSQKVTEFKSENSKYLRSLNRRSVAMADLEEIDKFSCVAFVLPLAAGIFLGSPGPISTAAVALGNLSPFSQLFCFMFGQLISIFPL